MTFEHSFTRTRRRIAHWLRSLRGARPPLRRAELWQGTRRKTYLVPYESSWRALTPAEAPAPDFGDSPRPRHAAR